MIHLLFIVLAGAGVLASAAAAGLLIYPRTPLPLAVRMTTGSAILSTLIFFVLLAELGSLPVFAALGLTLCVSAWFMKPVFAPALPTHQLVLPMRLRSLRLAVLDLCCRA